MSIHVYEERNFPHGLRCLDCHEVIGRGDWYESYEEYPDDSVAEVICLSCGVLRDLAKMAV